MEQKVKTFLDLPEDQREDYFIKEVWRRAGDLREFARCFKKEIKDRLSKKYFYMITFTIDPKKDVTESEAEAFIHAQAKRQALGIKQFYVSRELHKNKRSHWHVAIETTKPLKKDRFNYYTKKFGHIDFSRSKHNSINESLNYISKDVTPKQLV